MKSNLEKMVSALEEKLRELKNVTGEVERELRELKEEILSRSPETRIAEIEEIMEKKQKKHDHDMRNYASKIEKLKEKGNE